MTTSYTIPDRHDTSQPVRYKIIVKLSYKRSSMAYIGSLLAQVELCMKDRLHELDRLLIRVY